MVDLLKTYFRPGSPTFVAAAVAAGVLWLLARPRSRAPRLYLAAVAIELWLAATPLGVRLAMLGLTSGFDSIHTAEEAGHADAVVILGGGANTFSLDGELVGVLSRPSLLRALEGARVAKLLDARLVVASGGAPRPELQRRPESEIMRDVLVALGVPARTIVLESASRTTRDEARRLGPILEAHHVRRFVLVTSLTHMRRSLAALRAEGLDPIPSAAPVSSDEAPRPRWWLPNEDSQELFDEAVYEQAARIYYWWKGWT